MRKKILQLIVLMVGLSAGLCLAEKPSDGFFEFSSAPAVEAVAQNASDVLVFQGLEMRDVRRVSGR